MKKTKTQIKSKAKAPACNCWCCRVVPKPLDIFILLGASILIVYVFIKMAV